MNERREQPVSIKPRGGNTPHEPGTAAVGYCLGCARGERRRFYFYMRVIQTPDVEQIKDIAREVGVPLSTARSWHRDFLDQLRRDARESLQLHGLRQEDWNKPVPDPMEDDPKRPLAADR